MIKCDKGDIHVKGSSSDILAEFATLTYSLKNHFSEETIREVFEIGLMDEEETENKVNDVLIDVLKKLIEEMEGKKNGN